MTEEPTESPSQGETVHLHTRWEGLVRAGIWAGVCLAVVGLLIGLSMALKKRVASCPDGTYFPEGATDHNCYVHPQAGLGTSIAVISVLLGILVVFSGIVAVSTLRSSSAVAPAEESSS